MDKIMLLIHKLDEEYGRKKWERWREPVGELIRTILSQNTTDKNSLKAYADLKKAYPTWEDLLVADEADIAEVIRSGGLANIKSKKIKKGLAEIKAREGKIDLENLAAKSIEDATEYLTSLDGVGPKTAACVLIFSFNKPLLPVDTHIHRLSNRIGITNTTSREKTQEQLNELIPNSEKYSFHLNLIEHGRRICKASNPKCAECFLTSLCEYYKQLQK